MIEPTLRDRLTALYANWLGQDDFGRRYVEVFSPLQDTGVTSVRQFLEELLRLSLAFDGARLQGLGAAGQPESCPS